MVGEDRDVRVHALPSEADWIETTLKAKGLCNWLVDYSATRHVYCGAPATAAEGLCGEHSFNMFLGG